MPVVSIGANTADDFSGFEDAQIKSSVTDSNYGGRTNFETTKYASGNHTHTLIKASGLSNISGPVTVNSAYIYIYLTNSSNPDDQTVTIKHLLRDWIEGTQDGGYYYSDTPNSCCYLYYGNGANAWTTPGALSDGNDRAASAAGTITVNGTQGEYKQSTNISTLAGPWINGTLSNYGAHLERTDAADDSTYRVFASSEGTDGQRPYVYVDYTAGGGGLSIPVVIHHYKQQRSE